MSPPVRQVGSIADLDPVNDYYGSLSSSDRALSATYGRQAQQAPLAKVIPQGVSTV